MKKDTVELTDILPKQYKKQGNTPPAPPPPQDAQHLQQQLAAAITGEVRFDAGSKAAYATDGSNYRQVPIGVILPESEKDIEETIRICRQHNVPVLSRGGGTSLAGQCCNVAIVMDMSKYYNEVLDIDTDHKLVTVQPGIVLDMMKQFTGKQGLTFGPDPSTHSHCTIGGMLGNNSCGVHSVMAANEGYGARVSDNTEMLTILTYDGCKMTVGATPEDELENIIRSGGRRGEIYRKLRDLRDRYQDLIREKFPQIPRRVSGYNLDELLPEKGFNVARALVGTEGTCVTILDATMKLLPNPTAKSLVVLGYPDVYSAGRHAPIAMEFKPIGLEGVDDELIQYMRKRGLNTKDLPLLPPGKGWLLVEFGGKDKKEADEKARQLIEKLQQDPHPPTIRTFDNPDEEAMLWEIRESGLGATAFVPDLEDTWPGWEDSAVPPEKVGDYLQDLRNLFHKYGYEASLYGHFGQGCIHCRINFNLTTEEGIEKYKRFTKEAAELVVYYGGSLSGEHGDGQSRADLLEIMYGPELVQAFHEFKSIWDPGWKMNPGKVVNSYGQLKNLRLGADYKPANPETIFQFPDDEHNFSRSALRCVGVGKCRRHEGGTMCPSYMVTKEEIHSTRGRAHLLFEMLQGDVIKDGWNSDAVKDALDLCLACKGCKGDCPVNVDMATYKAEFLSHYYKNKSRPATAYAFGYIYWWSRLASIMPELANAVTHTPLISNLVKKAGGIASQRTMPRFAGTTFKSWFRHRGTVNEEKPSVILWADTFNNFFLPETLVAGVEVLEAAGYHVVVPRASLCCGRPLYDFGLLDTAKRLLQDVLHNLQDEIKAGVPVVGLEPSCVAVFRDELCNMYPDDEAAQRLKKQTFTLAEFLEEKATHFQIPALNRKALLHGHCHHKAIMKMTPDNLLLKKMQLDTATPATGCCGMAGYFGYEKGDHYEVSVKAGEHQLLPAVREAGKDTIIIADGFSCREQIEQETNRKGMHLAQVIQMALRENSSPAPIEYPEKKYVDGMKLRDTKSRRIRYAVTAGIALGIAALLFLAKSNKSST